MKKNEEISIIVKDQGAPMIHGGYILEIGKNIVALSIDLRSKYCDVEGFYGGDNEECGVSICATERSTNLMKKTDKDSSTLITLPDFIGWDVFSSNITRYTLRVCLIKNSK